MKPPSEHSSGLHSYRYRKRLPSTPYEAFAPVSDALSGQTLTHADGGSATAERLARQPEQLELLLAHLKDLGFHRVSSHLRGGSYALLLEGAKHQMIRIVHQELEPVRAADVDILQPITSALVGNYRIEVLPKVEILLDTPAQVHYTEDGERKSMHRELIKRLIHDNLRKDPPKLFYDFSQSNIGIIRHEGQIVPVIVDSGAVGFNDEGNPDYAAMLSKAADNFTGFLKADPEYQEYLALHPPCEDARYSAKENELRNYLDFLAAKEYPQEIPYAQAQEAHVAAIEPSGQQARINSLMRDLQAKLGFSEGEMGYLAGRAASEVSSLGEQEAHLPHEEQTRPGFCQMVRKLASEHSSPVSKRY